MVVFIRLILAILIGINAYGAIPGVTDFSRLIGPDHNSKKAFEQAINSDKPLVIKFYLIGCGPCKATDQAYAKMANAFKDKATFITLDVIKYEEVAKLFNIKTLPSWVIFAKKKKLAFIKGSKNQADVQKILAQYLAQQSRNQTE